MSAEAFDSHPEFERDGDGFDVTTAQFDATVTAGEGYRLRMELPTLDAVVVDETVGDAVEEGWYDTFRRRVATLGDGVTVGSADAPELGRKGSTVVVRVAFESESPADDALALVNFVEGTWFQGIVPGYEYRGDVQAMRERAYDRGQR